MNLYCFVYCCLSEVAFTLSHWFSEEFADRINQLQRTAKPPRMYREPMER
jgi:hypothetical protein